MSRRTIYRYEVPADDRWHAVKLCGSPLHVACRTPYAVEFWAYAQLDEDGWVRRAFRVYGTGQEIPANIHHHGTALTAGGKLVWHLMESFDISVLGAQEGVIQ